MLAPVPRSDHPRPVNRPYHHRRRDLVCEERDPALLAQLRSQAGGFVAGLGGRDVTLAGFEDIVKRGVEIAQKGSEQEYEIYGVRE